ncbi:hypothetical protein [Streptomyces sp. NPDC055085]
MIAEFRTCSVMWTTGRHGAAEDGLRDGAADVVGKYGIAVGAVACRSMTRTSRIALLRGLSPLYSAEPRRSGGERGGTGMARVVAVHGIGKQTLGEDTLRQQWLPALNDGFTRADRAERLSESDVAVAFYGDLFRPDGEFLAVGDPPYTAADVAEGFEQDLLLAWWKAAATSDPAVVPPNADDTLVATPRSVQAALRALSGSRFFAGVALRAMVFDLKQVHHYLTDPDLRAKALARVVVAHSLGSIIAYEALCARPDHQARALVTIGSPLGIENLILHRLQPAPLTFGGQAQGVWPGNDQLGWTNLADQGDVVALVKDLRAAFGDRVACAVVHNGAHAHDASAYLTDKLCGQASPTVSHDPSGRRPSRGG